MAKILGSSPSWVEFFAKCTSIHSLLIFVGVLTRVVSFGTCYALSIGVTKALEPRPAVWGRLALPGVEQPEDEEGTANACDG